MRVSGAGHMTRRLSAFLAGLGVAVLLGPLAGPGRGRTDPDGPADTGAEPDGKSLDGRHDRCARGRRVQWCHANRCGGFGNWHRCLQLSGQRHLAGPGQRRKTIRLRQGDRGHDIPEPVLHPPVQRLLDDRALPGDLHLHQLVEPVCGQWPRVRRHRAAVVAGSASTVGTLPSGWTYYTFCSTARRRSTRTAATVPMTVWSPWPLVDRQRRPGRPISCSADRRWSPRRTRCSTTPGSPRRDRRRTVAVRIRSSERSCGRPSWSRCQA